jgi:predicted nuclease with TOPRIM domain
MEIKTFDDVLKIKDEFSKKLAARMRTFEEATSGTLDEIIQEKRAILRESQARLEATEKARSEVLKRFEGELQRHRETVARLETDLKELRKTGGPKPRSGVGKTRRK